MAHDGPGIVNGAATMTRLDPQGEALNPADRTQAIAGAIDEPTGEDLLDPGGFLVRGWAFFPDNSVARVEVWLDNHWLGRAGLGRARPDVAVALGRDDASLAGFELFAELPPRLPSIHGRARLGVTVTLLDGSSEWWPPVSVHLADGGRPRLSASRTAPTSDIKETEDLHGRMRRRRAGNKSIRLLWFARTLDLGGSQLRMAEVIGHLEHTGGFRSTVLAPSDGPLRPILEAAGADVRPTPPVPLDDLDGYERAVADLSSTLHDQCDLVVGPTVSAFPAMDAAHRLEMPTVLRIGEAVPLRTMAHWVHGSLDAEIEERALHAIDAASVVWSNSLAAVRVYRELGVSGPFVVLGTGVDTTAAEAYLTTTDRAQSRERLDVNADDRLVVCAASIWGVKGQALLVQALDRLRASHPRLRCVLIGEAESGYTDAIRHYVSYRNLGDSIRILPFCHDLRPWWAAADAAAMPSESESLPAVVLEAMAFGLPVMATDVGDVSTLIEPDVTGWLSEPYDLGAIFTGLGAVAEASTQALQAMGATGAERVRRSFDRSECLTCTVELLTAAVTGDLPAWADGVLPGTAADSPPRDRYVAGGP